MNIIAKKHIFLLISGTLIAASIGAIAVFGLKPGIDFTGGSLLELSFSNARPTTADMVKSLDDLELKNSVVQMSESDRVIIRTNFLTEDQHQLVLKKIREAYQKDDNTVREESFVTIGSTVSQQLRRRALWAIIFVNLGIIAYVAYAFRKVSFPVVSWKYGLLAIVALLHDVLLVMGIFSLLGHYYGVEVDIGFVVAILTVLGYSVNDTIVVYDRIRENLLRRTAETFPDVVNNGLNQTLMRSINTTMTTLLSLLALYFFGGPSIHNFALALLVGIASGAYSSLFVASPLLVLVEEWQRKKA